MSNDPTPVNFAQGRIPIHRGHNTKERSDEADISVTTRYRNRTRHPIAVIQRSGVRLTLEPCKTVNPIGELHIQITYAGSYDVIKNILGRLDEEPSPTDSEQRHWKAAFKRALDLASLHATVIYVTVEYALEERHLDQFGGKVYLTDLDLIVGWDDHHLRKIRHPYCRQEIEQKSLEAVFTGVTNKSFVFMVRAIDNTGGKGFADRYVNIGGKVYQVPVERDENLLTGIHVIARRPVDSKSLIPGELQSEHYRFNDADKILHLHLSAEEAQHGGPLTDTIKDRLAAQVSTNKLEELELQRELTQVKAQYDQQLNTQRLVMEWIKTIATLLTAGLTIYAALRKVKS